MQYFAARQQQVSALKCGEKGAESATDPDKTVQELWRSKDHPRIYPDSFMQGGWEVQELPESIQEGAPIRIGEAKSK